jgi:hypothetical protein
MIDAAMAYRIVRVRQSRVAGCWPSFTHGGIMRIRRTVLAPVILTIGAVGSLMAVPAVAALTSVAPAATSVAGSASPDAYVYLV